MAERVCRKAPSTWAQGVVGGFDLVYGALRACVGALDAFVDRLELLLFSETSWVGLLKCEAIG